MPETKYLEFVLDQLAALGDVTAKSMFGGHGLYRDGVFFGIVWNGTLYLKTDDHTRAGFERRGLRPFQPYGDRGITMHYHEAPAEMFESREELLRWAKPAVEAGKRGATRKRPVQRKRSESA